MDYLRNHCWCSSSHWDNKHFNCQIIVSLSSYQEGYEEDWNNLTHKVELFSQEKLDDHIRFLGHMAERYPEEYTEDVVKKLLADKSSGHKLTSVLKPEVMDWLADNIADINGEKGWCVGSNDYLVGDGSGFSVFMQRRKDAMLFIKTWSKYKKPIHYCQYFTDVRKRLDLETLRYV